MKHSTIHIGHTKESIRETGKVICDLLSACDQARLGPKTTAVALRTLTESLVIRDVQITHCNFIEGVSKKQSKKEIKGAEEARRQAFPGADRYRP